MNSLEKDSTRDSWLEGIKLIFDHFKHLTTLNTAVLIISISVTEKLTLGIRWRPMLLIAYISFLASLYASLVMMIRITNYLNTRDPKWSGNTPWGVIHNNISIAGFFIGISCLVIIAVRNMF